MNYVEMVTLAMHLLTVALILVRLQMRRRP